ncbi:MAG: HmuY family protein, partial [Chitinophagaceae bacterium]|nr:HmuY family protein [Chitinophagaceae bacterium]
VTQVDSASTKWDFAIRFETFIVNSNASGPGNAGVQIFNQPFDAITTAPSTSYRYDTTVSQKAIKGADWYTYNPTTRSFSPIAGKTFVFRTATGKYAKLEMISADPADDLGNPVVPPTRPTKIKYKIRVAYQGDGSQAF